MYSDRAMSSCECNVDVDVKCNVRFYNSLNVAIAANCGIIFYGHFREE